MPAKVFVSHSCKDLEPELANKTSAEEVARRKRLHYARTVRDQIVCGLGHKGLGCKVLLDRKCLKPGDPWRARLHGWLGTCDGAVVLLSEDSIGSDWLRKEATILTWRKWSVPELLVVPVYLGDLRSSALKMHGLDCLQLTEAEAARLGPADVQGGGGKIEDLSNEQLERHASCLAQKVVETFKNLSALNVDSQLEKFVRGVSARLQQVRPILHLEEAQKALLIEDDDWSNEEEYADAHDLLGRTAMMAHQLISADFQCLPKAMKALRQGMRRDEFEWLVSRVACQWVDIGAAQQLVLDAHPHKQSDSESRMFALNAELEETAKAYVDRAYCCELAGQRKMVFNNLGGGEEAEKELRANFDSALRKHLNLPIRVKQKGKNLRGRRSIDPERMLKKRLKQDPFFSIINVVGEGDASVAATTLELLRLDHKNITFLLLTGADFSAIAGSLEKIQKLEPVILEEAEEDAAVEREYLNGLLS